MGQAWELQDLTTRFCYAVCGRSQIKNEEARKRREAERQARKKGQGLLTRNASTVGKPRRTTFKVERRVSSDDLILPEVGGEGGGPPCMQACRRGPRTDPTLVGWWVQEEAVAATEYRSLLEAMTTESGLRTGYAFIKDNDEIGPAVRGAGGKAMLAADRLSSGYWVCGGVGPSSSGGDEERVLQGAHDALRSVSQPQDRRPPLLPTGG